MSGAGKERSRGNLVIWSESPAETEELGKILGGILLPGDLFYQGGPGGAGRLCSYAALPSSCPVRRRQLALLLLDPSL